MRSFQERQAWRNYEEGRGPKPEIKAPLGRHMRKCTVCNHPEREAIEEEFLRWRSAEEIAEDYGFNDYSSIYRHARAAGLFEKRRATVRLALEPIIERAEHVEVTAASLVSVIRAYCSINDSGQWIDPPAHVIHHASAMPRTLDVTPPPAPVAVAAPAEQPAASPSLPAGPEPASRGRGVSNRRLQELESDSTP